MHNGSGVPKTPDLIDSREVCALLGIDKSTLTRWVQVNKLTPAMRVGGNNAYLFQRSDIEALRDAA